MLQKENEPDGEHNMLLTNLLIYNPFYTGMRKHKDGLNESVHI